jgi:hypothetical protein
MAKVYGRLIRGYFMKTLIAVLLISFAASAHATKLLDCNTPVGPDQEVTVLSQRDGSLAVIELTANGDQLPGRSLSSNEWTAKNIILRDGSSVLVKEQGQWIVKDGIEIAPADCE